MNEYKVYQPQYFKKFHCTGSECKDNCCHNWVINIDEATYDKYMSLDEEARKEFTNKIEVTGKDPFNAKMILDENRNCRFLDDRGLCSIHARYGHEYLSHTCRAYPRKFCNVAGETEAFLGLSCEVAAKIILLEQSIMRFENGSIKTDGQLFPDKVLDVEKYASVANAAEVFWKLRTASIVIVQSRQYRLSARMLILGMFINQAAELLSAGRFDEIAGLSEKYLERLDSNSFSLLIEQALSSDDLDIKFLLGLLRDMGGKLNKKYDQIMEQACDALGISPGGEIPDSFNKDFKSFYEMYFADNEYIIENYVVSHIFSDGFPFNYNYEDSIMKNYKELLVKYNLVKVLLVGISRRNMKFDKRRVVECISSFSRAYDHHIGGALIMK